jgi:hypothetical protein
VRVGTKTAPPPSKDLKDGCRDIIFNRPVREFYLGICDRKLLYSGGRPTSLVLLLRVQVSELPLPLGSHPSLSLHDLLCLVGASGGLVALGGIEVVEVLALALALGALGPVEVERMGAGATAAAVGNSAAVSAACYKALAGLLEVLVGTVDLVELVGEGIVILGLRSANTGADRSGGALVFPVVLAGRRRRPLGVVVVGHGRVDKGYMTRLDETDDFLGSRFDKRTMVGGSSRVERTGSSREKGRRGRAKKIRTRDIKVDRGSSIRGALEN